MKTDFKLVPVEKEKSFLFVIITFLLFFNACSSSLNNNYLSPEQLISLNSIEANLAFLASDELEGREAATRGEKLAALFISSELKKYGVKPFYNDYLQEYDLYSISTKTDSKVEIVSNNGEKNTLFYPDNFLPNRRSSVTTQGKYNLVFAGFGITAPEFDYDDYKSINVKNKIVIITDKEPYSTDSTYFDGLKDSEYSKESFKISLAKKLGAAGIISIPSDFYLKNWDRIKIFAARESLTSPGINKEKLLNLIFNEESLSMLFDNEEYSFKAIKDLLNEKKPLPVFELNKKIEIDVVINEEIKKSFNVAGIIEGNDSLLMNEYVSIGAHYDHVGIIDGKVYNGADDNGSGTAALLEISKAFANTKLNKRSILVVFHGAEEKGLLGSEYFTDNFENIENIIAHINMDMVGREHIDTLYSVGSGKISSEFQTLVEDVNSQTVNFVFNYKFDDPADRQRIFYRSDHYNYAKHGIPVVFSYDYMTEDYHKHSDEIDKINFEKIRKTAFLVYSIALRTSNMNTRLKIDEEEIYHLTN